MATTMVHIRVDEKVKARAAKALSSMGMSVSEAVRILLVRVAAEKALPLEVKVPDRTAVKAMEATDDLINALDSGDAKGITSVLTLLEVLVQPIRSGRLDRERRNRNDWVRVQV